MHRNNQVSADESDESDQLGTHKIKANESTQNNIIQTKSHYRNKTANCLWICVVLSDSARVTRAQVSDSATYTCIASNRAGVDNKHYNLQVHGESRDVTGASRKRQPP